MDHDHIPKGIKIVTLARSIRWFGWGMCETLIPVLLFSFSYTYVEAGIFRAIYDIVFLISLPFVSILGNRVPAKSLILFALALYPLIGISYFLAGALGITFLIVFARTINGITWCCDSVGGDTYLRRFASQFHLSKTFGYLTSLPNLSWIIAALVSIPLLTRVPIYYLFLAIIPTSVIAYFVMKQAPRDEVPVSQNTMTFTSNIIQAIKGMRHWDNKLRLLVFLMFLTTCIDLLGTFFLPLFVYSVNSNLREVVIITVLYALPYAGAFWFGKYIDTVPRWIFVAVAFASTGVLLGALSFFSNIVFQLFGIFLLGILTVCIGLALQAIATEISNRDRYGSMSGLMTGAEETAAVVGPIAIGILFDAGGMQNTLLMLATVSVATAVVCIRHKPRAIKF